MPRKHACVAAFLFIGLFVSPLAGCVTTTSRSAAPFVPLSADEAALVGVALTSGIPLDEYAPDGGDLGIAGWARARPLPPIELTLHGRTNVLVPVTERRATTAAGVAGAFLIDAGPLRIGPELSVEAEAWWDPPPTPVLSIVNGQVGVPMRLALGDRLGLYARTAVGLAAFDLSRGPDHLTYHFSAGARVKLIDRFVVLVDAGAQQDVGPIAYASVALAVSL